jgi:hypothetical protein
MNPGNLLFLATCRKLIPNTHCITFLKISGFAGGLRSIRHAA